MDQIKKMPAVCPFCRIEKKRRRIAELEEHLALAEGKIRFINSSDDAALAVLTKRLAVAETLLMRIVVAKATSRHDYLQAAHTDAEVFLAARGK